ncbi:MAG: EamA family transporter [Clostridia bacterium]|nr:EamA family transporter [Clostridia bacterium]
MKKSVSTVMVLLAAALWGSMGLFVRYFGGLGLGSMDIVFLRVSVAAVLLPAVVAILRPAAFKIRWKDLWCFAGTGLLSIAMFNFCYFKTMTMTSLSVAAVLLYLAPAIVVLVSALLFKERITRIKVLACLLAFAGCVLVSDLQGGSIPPLALLTGFLSAFGYAMYSIFSRLAMDRGYHSFTILLYTFWFSILGVAPFTDLPGTFEAVRQGGWPVWGMVLLMGIVTAVLPYAFYTLGLAGLEAGKASVMASLEPVVATLLGAAIFREIPSLVSAAGILLVLAGVVLLNVRFKKV